MKAELLPVNMRNKIVVELSPVAMSDFCWAWTGCLNSRGYGCVAVRGKSQLAHRVSYELLAGPIPTGLHIDHLCLNKRCINPAHLEPVTPLENTRRALDVRGRDRCVNGHPMAGLNLVIRHRNGWEYRTCRMCQILTLREARARRAGGTRIRRAPAVLPLRDAALLEQSERALAEILGGAA